MFRKHFSMEEPLKYLFISRDPVCENKRKNYKEKVLTAWRLLQYSQQMDKNSRHISRYIYNFAVIQSNYVFIPLFPSEPLTEFRGTLRFHGTLFEKHWINHSTPSPPIYFNINLILPFHLKLSFSCHLFHSWFLTKPWLHLLFGLERSKRSLRIWGILWRF